MSEDDREIKDEIAVIEQLMTEPGREVSVDPDVADEMGAFEEDALDYEDAILSATDDEEESENGAE